MSNQTPQNSPQPWKKGMPKDATVLVVEDNVSNFVLIARMLGFLGIHCEWKTSGYEVVEYADTLPRLDLILMDIRLPYEDGYGALRKIRQAPHLRDIPIVAVTAEGGQQQMNKARGAGFNGFLAKPLDPDLFPDQIQRILAGESVWRWGMNNSLESGMHDFFTGLVHLPGNWIKEFSKAAEKRFPRLVRGINNYRSSLTSVVVNVLVLLALIPVILVAGGVYVRSHAFIQERTIQQLESLVNSESHQLSDIAKNDQQYLTDFLNDTTNKEALNTLLSDPTQTSKQIFAWARLQNFVESTRKIHTANVDAAIVLSPAGLVYSASRFEWNNLDLSGVPVFQQLSGSTKTFPVYSLSSLYTNQWVTLSSKPILDDQGALLATLIIADIPQSSQAILETSSSIFQGGKAYYVTFDNSLIGNDPKSGSISQVPDTSSHAEELSNIFQSSAHQGTGIFDGPDLAPVFSYAKWIPEINLGFVVEIPEGVVFRQINDLLPAMVLLLSISLVFITIVVFFGSRILVSPITQLTKSARNFAKGDWSERSTIKRRDEIGILASTFNQMVEQISDLYRSLEQKVEERARQLRTASEVGQLATSATNREEIIERAVKLVIDRFGYSFASIFVVDQSGLSAVLMAAYSQSGEMKNHKGYRISVGSDSLVGWVAKNNQARVIADLSANDFPYSSILQGSSKSEVALPIAVGNEILGVFEVQTVNLKGFEPESISVLQTLSNQIANGLQNLLLLEATQVNLQETNLLYRTSRQITLTKSEPEMFQVVNEALAQTPYVSGIFSVEEDYLSILSITDPRNPSMITSVQGITLPLQRVLSALEHSQTVMVDDLAQANEFDVILSFFTRRGCHSAAIFTIRDQEQLSKIIVLGSRETDPITQTAIQPFSSLVEVIGTTRQRFQIMHSLEERVTTLQTLNQIGEAISAETDLMVLYQTLHAQVVQTIGQGISFLIALYNPRENQIEIPYVFEGDQLISIPPFPLGEGLVSLVIQKRQPLMIVKDTEQQIQNLGARIIGKPAKSWLGVPLVLGNQAIGAMVLQDTEHEERFTNHDLNLFVTLAPQVAVTVRNAQLLSEMGKALRNYDQERFLLNTLMSNTPDQVTFKDMKGQYIRVSQSYADQFSIGDPLTLVGKSDFDLFSPETAASRSIEAEQILTSGQALLGNVEKTTLNDQEAWKLSSHIPMIDPNGGKVGLLGIDRDITSLKQAEQIAESRAEDLQIAAEIARDISGTLDTAELLANSVNLIRDRFGFYHASIFLLDSIGEFAVLRELTGEVGAQMKQRGHRLAVGSQSIVGQVTERKQPWIVNDVSQEPLHYENPLLPETRSELAIPLTVGDKILGAVDVQSRLVNAFSPEEVKILQILADQLAIAVWNSILFSQTQETLAQHRLLHQITIAASASNTTDEALETTIQALHNAKDSGRVMIMFLDHGILTVRATAGYEGIDVRNYSLKSGEGIPGQAIATRQPARINDLGNHPEITCIDPSIQSELAVPIFFSDRTVGILDLASTNPGAFDETDQEIMASLGNTLGAIIANADLVREVRSQVQRQQVLYDITSRIRKTADIQTILETSAREIARSLGAKRAHIELEIATKANPNEVTPEQGGKNNGNGHSTGKEVTR